MSTHALFSPSAAHRWIECPGSFAYPGNTGDSESSTYADDGAASHEWASMCLQHGKDALYYLGCKFKINGKIYLMDEERAGFVQVYLDHVRQLALGKLMLVEHWIDLPELGEGQGGTCDAGIIEPNIVTVIDFKYGMGEKVEAGYRSPATGDQLPNHQLGLYGAGLLRDAWLLGYNPALVRLIVCQPRISNISESTFTIGAIERLMGTAVSSSRAAGLALVGNPEQAMAAGWMNPGEKTCRWCRAKAECPALAKYVADSVRSDFETVSAETLRVETDVATLSRNIVAVPLIEDWCSAVRIAVHEAVDKGLQVIGSDGLPMKFVEGKLGNRAWENEEAAETALSGQLPPEKMYQPRKIITAPQAAKILDKPKTKQLWKDVFEPLIKRSPGKPILALGSDERPPYTGRASAEEFDEQSA